MGQGGDDFDVHGQFILDASPEQIESALGFYRRLITQIMEQAQRKADQAVRDQARRGGEQRQKDYAKMLADMAGVTKKHVAKMNDIEKAALAESRKHLDADRRERERRDKQRLDRLAARQRSAAKERLETEKATNRAVDRPGHGN